MKRRGTYAGNRMYGEKSILAITIASRLYQKINYKQPDALGRAAIQTIDRDRCFLVDGRLP